MIVTVKPARPRRASLALPRAFAASAFTFANDPSSVDQAASFTFAINWGDGFTQTVTDFTGMQVNHTFTATGTFAITVTATDKDGGVSQIASQLITINAVELQGSTLAIGGTTAGDNITVKPANTAGGLSVTVNGANLGTFTPAQLIIFGQAGNDNVQLATNKIQGTTYYVVAPAVILGDAGNDTLDARGSSAENLLIGGTGADTLQGGLDGDILIGGTTDFDANSTALFAILSPNGAARTLIIVPHRPWVGH